MALATKKLLTGNDHGEFAIIFLWIAILLIAAKLSGVVERFGQPAALGELAIGIILDNLALFRCFF